jgi:signal transduction histidine kinase/ligand-binding sensor domain-containing protein/CheY-like chemotaxis protein/AraC-like DNA-binding protein
MKNFLFRCSLLILYESVFFIFLCFSASTICAQIPDYKFNHLNFEDGLSNLNVSCFAKDELGFIWIGTEDGLNRFDSKNIKVYKHIKENDNSISNNKISALLATENFIWIGSEGYGIDRYNLKKDVFEHFQVTLEDGTVYPKKVNVFFELKNKNILIGADNGLYIYDTRNDKLNPYLDGEAEEFLKKTAILSIHEDEEEKIFLGTDKGIFFIHPENKSNFQFQTIFSQESDGPWVQYITKGPDNRYYVLKLNYLFIIDEGFEKVILKKKFDQYISECRFDMYGRLWIVGDGLFLYDNHEFKHLKNDPLNPYSISDKLTKSIYIDNDGIIWVGTWNSGISYFNPENERHRITNLMKRIDKKGLPENPVDFLFEDHKKRIWISTNWGGITIYDLKNGDIQYLSTASTSNPQISADLNYSTLIKDDKIWIGTFRKGLDCYDINTEKITNHLIPVINGQMPKINKIDLDPANNIDLLLCTEVGLIRYNTLTDKSYYYSQTTYNLPNGQYLDACFLDKSRMVIIVDKVGMFLYNSTNNTFQPFLHDKISSNILNTLRIDRENNFLLIGANNGLNILDLDNNKLHIFNSEQGLSNENIVGIVKDQRGYYWLSTSDGLCLTDIKRAHSGEIIFKKIRNLNSFDGLVGNQFRNGAALKASDGKLLFGTNSGLTIFEPEIYSFETEQPEVLISEIKVFNKSVIVNPDDEDAILRQSIFYTDKIELSHKENSVSFYFTALDYFNNNINYRYILEGFDHNWIKTNNGTAVYTNLNPGNYIFKVKPDTDSFPDAFESAQIEITITPPFYQTKFFIISGIAFLTVIVFTFYFLRLRYYKERQAYLENVVAERTHELKQANKNLLEKNKEISSMAKRVHEADEMKLRFFTNIHHEFRTALSLIIGPVEQLKNNKSILNKAGDDIQIISSNAKRLLSFVNEILDYRKIDAGKFGLNIMKGDAIGFLKEIKSLFDCKARELEIDYTFHSDFGTEQIYFDSQKFEHIIFNLLSNAFKNTERKGKIKVEVSTINSSEKLSVKGNQPRLNNFKPGMIDNRIASFLEIAIVDDGIGFKDEEQVRLIWERFYRLPNKNLNSNVGSGIGLALTKELTQIHQGLICAETNTMGGATFKVWFPRGSEWFTNCENLNIVEEENPSTTRFADVDAINLIKNSKLPVATHENDSLPIVLIIEDNVDIHLFLNNHLNEYRLRFAESGKEGMEMAEELVPDLIVCDIMLPDIQGYHIVKQLKNHMATSHIPIIMLTALIGEDNIIKALNIGADDYVTKPFTINRLKARINNLLNLREKLREIYSLKSEIRPKEFSTNPVDQQFYARLNAIILENVDNYNFSVVDLADLMGMSRVQLYRKVNSITKKGPAELIRKIRLNHSKTLLKSGNHAVSDIAVKLGYSESSSFIRAFVQEYGISPLIYAKKYGTLSNHEKK